MMLLAAVAGSASAAYVSQDGLTTTTYDGSGALNTAANWSSGSPTNDNPGLVSGTVSATSSELSSGGAWNGFSVRQTGGTLFRNNDFALRGGVADVAGSHSILEIDDASNTGSYNNLKVSGRFTMWNQNGKTGATGSTLSVLNGYATVGEFWANSGSKAKVFIGNGTLKAGTLADNANCVVTMLDGGTGAFNIGDIQSAAYMNQMLINFETGSKASFTIGKIAGATTVAYWETKIAAGKVKIDGSTVNDLSRFTIENVGDTGTKILLTPPNTQYLGVGVWSDVSPSPGWDNGVPTIDYVARLITTAAVTIQGGTAAVAATVYLGNTGDWDGGHVVVNSGGSLTATHMTMGSASANGGGASSFTNHPGGIVTLSGELSLANGTSSVFNDGMMSVGSLGSTAGGAGVLNIDGGTFTAGNISGFDLSANSGFTIDIRSNGVLQIAGSSQAEADQLNTWHQTVGSITSDVPLFAVYNLQTAMTTLGPATALDLDPPTPNPAEFTSQPIAISYSEISMTAAGGSDASGWIQYRFDETSGNPGGTGSGWQTSSSYTDEGLNPDTQYSYTVTMRDVFGNTTTASPSVAATTDTVALADLVDDRLVQMVQRNVESPYPSISDPNNAPGVFSYALACLYLDQNVEQANQLIVNFYTNNPIPGSDTTDFTSYFWQHILWRIYHDPVMNARLTSPTRDLIEDNMWLWLNTRSKLTEAQQDEWIIHDSENHDVMQKGSHMMCLIALKSSSRYGPDKLLADGGTITEHADAWTAFYMRYFRARAMEGINVEIACQQYAKYTVGAYYNIMDFSDSPELRALAKTFMDLYWADTVSDWTRSGVRGGAETRVYKDGYLRKGTPYSFHALLWAYGWHERADATRTYALIPTISSYRVPDIITASATDPARPNFLYSSRRFGRGGNWDGNRDYTVVFDNGDSNLRRDTWVTPDYTMGTFTVDMNKNYIALLDQNRTMGVMFASGVNDRIMVFGKGGSAEANKSFADLSGVTRADCMVVQRDKNAYLHGDATRVFLSTSAWTNGVENGGWFFTQLDNAYCAIKPAGGGYTAASASNGYELELGDLWAPVIIQTGQASHYDDFAAFQASVMGNTLTYVNGTMNYTSDAGDLFTFYGNSKTTPKVNGVTVDLNPTKVYDSPYLSMTHGEDVATVSYGAYTNLVLDFGIPPSVINDGATDVGFTDATLNGTVVTTGGASTEVSVYWDLTDKGTTKDNWDNSHSFGPTGEGSLATNVTGLSSDTPYYYRFYATNMHGEDWSAASTFTTEYQGPPSVTNNGATGVGLTDATLNGTVVTTGGASTEVSVYWDLTDKGTTKEDWVNSYSLGTAGEGSLATNVTGLSPETPYYYRFYATNTYGEDWSVASNFTTVGLNVTTAGGAQIITQGVARLNGDVNKDTDISIFWDVVDRGPNSGGWAKSVMLGGVAAGTFSTDASNLLYGLTYYYRCFASNTVDGSTVWSSAAEFSLPVPAGSTQPVVLHVTSKNLSDTGTPGSYAFENVPYTIQFNAGASADKLIVSYSSEGGAANATITYNGDSLTRIADTKGDRHGGIWYLDSPYTGGNADLVIDLTVNGTVNGLGYGVVSISGSYPGVATAAYQAGNTVTITPTAAGSFVVAGFGANGTGSGDPGAPLSELYSGNIGSAYGGAGYETNVSASSQTYTFAGANGGVGAAAFAPDAETDPTALDANDDGIPDPWSVQHFANDPFVAGQADSDPDGDSRSNYKEYVAGSSPTDGSDFFEVSIVQSNGELIISVPSRLPTSNFYGSLKRRYGLEYSTSLLGTSWFDVLGATDMPATGFDLLHTNEHEASRLFYRGKTWLE